MSAKIPAKPAKDTIYIDVDDEITGIIDKVENSENKVVALVLPKRATSLQSIVNMKLLKRSADTAGKNVVLITSEAALLPLAGAAGLHVAKNLQSAPEIPDSPRPAPPASPKTPAEDVLGEGDETEEETDESTGEEEDLPKKFDYSRPIGALAARHEAENPETIDLDDEDETAAEAKPKAAKAPKGAKVKVPNFDKFRLMLGLGILTFIALIVFIFLALFVLPKATVTIQTTSEPVSATFNLTASVGGKLDSSGGSIPAKLESTNQTSTQQVTATGQQNNGQQATATLTITNCTNNQVVINPGTGVSSGSLNYIVQKPGVSLGSGNFDSHGNCKTSGNHIGTVNITAQQGGSSYNTPPSGAFTIAGYASGSNGVTGSNFQLSTKGTDSITTVLSQSDVDGATQKLTTSSTADAFTKSFEDKLASQNEYVFVSTLNAGTPQVSANPAVGQPASTSTVSITINYTVLAVQKSDLSTIIQAKLAGQIDKTKQKLNGNFLNDANISVESQPSANSVVLSVDENTTAVPIISVASVKKIVEGQKVGDIKNAISGWDGVKNVDVKLSPFWVSKAPKKDSKITVVLQEVKNSSSNNNSAP